MQISLYRRFKGFATRLKFQVDFTAKKMARKANAVQLNAGGVFCGAICFGVVWVLAYLGLAYLGLAYLGLTYLDLAILVWLGEMFADRCRTCPHAGSGMSSSACFALWLSEDIPNPAR